MKKTQLQFQINLPENLHEKLKAESERTGISMSSLIKMCLNQNFQNEEVQEEES